MMPISNSERLSALIAEYRSLDRERDGPRIRDIAAEAAHLVDRQAAPKKWAAFRSMYAQLAEADDPEAALVAYQDALTVWRREDDPDSWQNCHASIGLILAKKFSPGTEGAERAIEHLGLVAQDQPYLAGTLALLYRFRSAGDPGENWQLRVKYLELFLIQISCEQDPNGWAAARNEIGLAYAEQPNAPFDQSVEKRIHCHQEALEALGELKGPVWIDTCLQLGECYEFRVLGERLENHQLAEQYSRQALNACEGRQQPDLERRALLSIGRILAREENSTSLHESLTFFDRAASLIDPALKPELLANIDTLRAGVYSALMRLGETQWLPQFFASSQAALSGWDPHTALNQRRNTLQILGEGLLEAGDFVRAEFSLQEALQAGEALLAQATTVAGRMERIFQLKDSSALLSYCCLKQGNTQRALEFLDRGKARFWSSGHSPETLGDLTDLVPVNGALLFPVFAFSPGAVIVVTRDGPGVSQHVVWLPHFDHKRFKELQRGGAKELGGWLYAYSYRNSQPDKWKQQIDQLGGILYDEVWSPVLEQLQQLGITSGAELVWFPQGGSGVFPMHAAWTAASGERRWLIQDYAIRYAPAVKSLSRGSQFTQSSGPDLLVANPMGDLTFSDLECAWVRRSVGKTANVLIGEAATKEAVLAKLPGCNIAHFSTHAMFNLDNPLQSSIWLAGKESLTLEELLPALTGQPPTFVILSACETAMTRVTGTPDEFLGFPAALLDHGTRTVLATLWPVDDAASAVLIGRFYREYANGQTAPAQALRLSQDWLRLLTIRELMELLRELRGDPAPVGPLAAQLRTMLRGAAPDLCPFAEPYYWAAFTVSGQ